MLGNKSIASWCFSTSTLLYTRLRLHSILQLALLYQIVPPLALSLEKCLHPLTSSISSLQPLQ